MHKPEISVILSTYSRNHGAKDCDNLLKRALDSILAQKFSDFELVLIDDGSTDGTQFVCQDYANCDKRIRHIRYEQNSRLPAKRYNQGIENSRGKFIAFMFDDDEWKPNALNDLYQAIKELPPSYGMVYGLITYYSTKLDSIFDNNFGLHSIKKLKISNMLANNSVLIRREVFDYTGGYDESPFMRRLCDWDLWLRLTKLYKVKRIDCNVGKVYDSYSDSLVANFDLNLKKVRLVQLIPFRKLPLKKYYFPSNLSQCFHFFITSLTQWFYYLEPQFEVPKTKFKNLYDFAFHLLFKLSRTAIFTSANGKKYWWTKLIIKTLKFIKRLITFPFRLPKRLAKALSKKSI